MTESLFSWLWLPFRQTVYAEGRQFPFPPPSMSNKQPTWDPGRFLQTLAFFDALPFWRCIQTFLKRSPSSQTPAMKVSATSQPILVVGATGGVGKRVVQQLQAQGHSVRALVRDLQKGREILGDRVEVIDADITIPETLTAAVVENIRAVICCTGPRVQPQQGDTPDRARYYQGIKFYLPEVVGDSPEAIDYQGIQNLLQAVAQPLQANSQEEILLFDFSTGNSQVTALWGALDDVVMGGVSASSIQAIEAAALFRGNVSTANSGGFASVRSRNLEPALNLTGYAGIKLRLKGDGNRYKFLLRSDTRWDSIAYSYSFDTPRDRWSDIYIPFRELIPVFRAKTVPDAPAINQGNICSLQLMLSKFEYDGGLNPHFTPGEFALQIQAISAYSQAPLPQFVLVSSAGVTRPGRPGLNLEEEPPAVRMNDQLGGILTWKLRGEEALRQSGIPYTIVRPCALTEEPGGKRLIVDQGDNLRGKISRDDVATLCIQALQQPAACNLTFEVSSAEEVTSTNWAELFAGLRSDGDPSTPAP